MHFYALTALLFLGVAGALAGTVTVTTPQQGQFVGHSLEFGDQFYGIRYAQAPVGNLRFAKTLATPTSGGVQEALRPGAACMQPAADNAEYPHSEDCLFLNIYRPPAASRQAPLPVFVFIHGGSWINGSSTDALYNGKDFVTRSVQLGEPTLLVTLNYRLGVMGFIAGFEAVAADKAGTAVLNAGYWDQRTALKWIQDNIAAFGGNPAKVTLSGQSAGANSVAAQMLANGGQTEGLFRAAILQSGSQALSPRFKATDAAGLAAYSILLAQTMCLTLKCLRSRSAVQLIKAQSVITQITGIKAPFLPTMDSFFVQELPSAQFAAGRFPTIPIISGTTLDEGTLFSPSQVYGATNFDFNAVAYTGGPAVLPLLQRIHALYPDVPSLGAPFNTTLFGINSTDRLIEPKRINEFKRMSAFLTDVWLDAGRRQQLRATSQRVDCFSYLFAQPDPSTMLTQPELGVYHGGELPFVFAHPPVPFTGEVKDPPTAAAAKYAGPADVQRTADIMSAAWIHFANNLSPAGQDVPDWPAYGADAQMLQIQGIIGTQVITDDFRREQIDFFLQNPKAFLL